ncbi:MAG TPA: dihydroorotate dehydrogenase-like protein, partial [Actinomycetota bacterium]|nr:dihydroorotate dehydrogenase-like protein [Actinomycetota bacterium]
RGRVDGSLASTTGVHSGGDALKMILAGADVVMVASCLFRNGPEHLGVILDDVRTWLADRGYGSVEQAKGSVSQINVGDPVAYARSNYMQMLVSYSSPYDWREIPGSVQA